MPIGKMSTAGQFRVVDGHPWNPMPQNTTELGILRPFLTAETGRCIEAALTGERRELEIIPCPPVALHSRT